MFQTGQFDCGTCVPGNMNHLPGFTICRASENEAGDLAVLAVMAGDGLPLVTWEAMREGGESVMDAGRRRAARKEGAFSYRNAEVAFQNGRVVAAVVSWPLEPGKPPDPLEDVPPLFRPLAALENKAIPSWHINVLACRPEARGQGAGTALLGEVEKRARLAGYRHLSLIVTDANPARALYERVGFRGVAREAMAATRPEHAGQDWILMVKPVLPGQGGAG